MTNLICEQTAITRAQDTTISFTEASREMLLGLIFTPTLYKHITWPIFHVPVVKLESPTSPLGDVHKFKIDQLTAEITDIKSAFKHFPGVRKYIKSITPEYGFLSFRVRGSLGLSMLTHIVVTHLKARYPNWLVVLDTESLYSRGKHKRTFS